MRDPRHSILLGLVAGAALAGGDSSAAQTAITLGALEPYGTFHAIGVVATVAGDSDGDGSVALAWRRPGEPAFRAAHPLVRIDPTRFVGSLFALDPGQAYEVRVTVADPDGVGGPPSATVAATTRSTLAPFVPSRTLYVAPGGDDGNPGTDPGQPLATVQEAADRAVGGDLVSIAAGVYREEVSVPSSGSALAPIVFRGEPGAVLDGADASIATGGGSGWSAETDGVWARAIGFATGHVVTDQGRLFRYDSLADLRNLPAGPPGGFWLSGGTLRIKLEDGSSPATRTIHVARRENGITLDGRSHVWIENLEIRHYGSGDYGKGVYLRYANDCVVRGNNLHEVGAAGVWIKGGSRNLVEDNDLWDTAIPGWDWDWTKGSSAENNAVVLTDDVGRGNVVRRNRIAGTFNGIGPCGGSAPPTGFTNETDVYDNQLADHNDDALEPEGYCANVRMWGNRIRDVHMAFAVAPAAPGPTWILRNVAHDFGSTRTSQLDGYLASALKINSGYATPIGPLFLYHNTFLTTAPDTSALTLLNPGESTYVVGRNNLFAGTDHALYKVNPVTLDLDGDDLWTSHPSLFVRWEGTSYATLAALRTGAGQELAGIAAAPELADATGGDYLPGPTSPLRDAGLILPGINDDWIGAAPDIGALECCRLFADGFEDGDTSGWSATAP